MRRTLTLSIALTLSLAALTAAQSPPVSPAIEAAILPGADFLARFDPAAVERSPLVRSLWGDGLSRLAARLESSGITASDISEVLVSARGESVAPEGARRGERANGVPAVFAVSLARSRPGSRPFFQRYGKDAERQKPVGGRGAAIIDL
jgi:hypothetical protein